MPRVWCTVQQGTGKAHRDRGDKIVALRPVEVYSEDYALAEYGVTTDDLTKFADKTDREVAADKKRGRLRRHLGNLEKDL